MSYQKSILFLFFSLLVSALSAQDLETLKKQLDKTTNKSEQAEILNQLGETARDANLIDAAINYHLQALERYEDLNDKNGQALSLNFLGTVYWRANDFESATQYYTLALEIRKEQKNKEEIARILNNLGLVCRSTRDYRTAIDYYHQALFIWEKAANNKEIASTLNQIGNLYLSRNMYDSALMNYRKSLEIRTTINDTVAIAATMNNIATLYKNQNEFDSAIIYLEKSIDMLWLVNDKPGLADGYNNLGGVYWSDKKYKVSLENYLKALDLREEIGDKNQIAATMNNIGLIYKDLGNYEKALEYYNKSLEQYQAINDRFLQSEALNFIGGVYWQSGDYQKARDKYIQSLSLREDVGDKKYIARSHNNLALVYKSLNEPDSALVEYQQSLSIYKEIGDQKNVAAIMNNIGNLHRKFNEIESAVQHFKIALEIRLQIDDQIGQAYTELDLGNLYTETGKPTNALPLLDHALTIAKKMKNSELEKDVQFAMAQAYSKKYDFQSAYSHLNDYTILKDSILSTESIKKIADMQIRYETEKKEKEIQVGEMKNLQLTEKNHRQRNLIYFAIIGILLVSGFALLLSSQNKKIKKAYELLGIQNQQISQQKTEIEVQRDIATKQRDQITEQKQKITDSIEYASRIQAAVLPPSSLNESLVPNHFIMFKPRDIVSGDFYWMTRIGQQVVVAAVDCTGHGVPGAFMSMLGMTLLNQIASKGQPKNAAEILNELRMLVKNALHQTGNDDSPSDGMDCSLCVIDYQHKKIQFAGANNPLYIIRNGELIEYEADRMPIGVHLIHEEPFTNQEIEVFKHDMLYMFSDGYYDQFGGANGRKLFNRNFREILLEIHAQPIEKQKTLLEQKFEEWKGNYRQIDDVLVIGISME